MPVMCCRWSWQIRLSRHPVNGFGHRPICSGNNRSIRKLPKVFASCRRSKFQRSGAADHERLPGRREAVTDESLIRGSTSTMLPEPPSPASATCWWSNAYKARTARLIELAVSANIAALRKSKIRCGELPARVDRIGSSKSSYSGLNPSPTTSHRSTASGRTSVSGVSCPVNTYEWPSASWLIETLDSNRACEVLSSAVKVTPRSMLPPL